jgi:hypothetical protein
MSLVGKNRKVFSYNNQDKRKSNFTYKDFEKSNSYHTDFSECNFSFASLRAAKFKFCSFWGATFIQTEFVGTNLRRSNFTNAVFRDCIFKQAILDRANFNNAVFENTIFIATKMNTAQKLSENTTGIICITHAPRISDFSKELIEATEKLRQNNIVRRSNVLHMKRGQINTIYLSLLMKTYSEEELIKSFQILPEYLTTQFHTLSYLENLLKKLRSTGII